MGQIHAEAEAIIEAPASEIYATLADYREGHPKILPNQYFSNLQVEQGGKGAGTVVSVTVTVYGVSQNYHLVVSEPEVGRVLIEEDKKLGLVTTFTVTPLEQKRTKLKIATDAPTKPGLKGLLESWMQPSIMRGIYKKQLKQISTVLATQQQDFHN